MKPADGEIPLAGRAGGEARMPDAVTRFAGARMPAIHGLTRIQRDCETIPSQYSPVAFRHPRCPDRGNMIGKKRLSDGRSTGKALESSDGMLKRLLRPIRYAGLWPLDRWTGVLPNSLGKRVPYEFLKIGILIPTDLFPSGPRDG